MNVIIITGPYLVSIASGQAPAWPYSGKPGTSNRVDSSEPDSASVMNRVRPSGPPKAAFVVPAPRGLRTVSSGRPRASKR